MSQSERHSLAKAASSNSLPVVQELIYTSISVKAMLIFICKVLPLNIILDTVLIVKMTKTVQV
ncbi:hypothetical protein T11_17276 [Trichinella zimbabwensis]|uniref:Uncharacterized protein n=1 Tax=Trichinella zimbabwensis TaxID=268475 RepID=A0A0V1GBP2_9BILA|nr:hypothetical protein T11_17276 [Trichinella zimbabwensis]